MIKIFEKAIALNIIKGEEEFFTLRLCSGLSFIMFIVNLFNYNRTYNNVFFYLLTVFIIFSGVNLYSNNISYNKYLNYKNRVIQEFLSVYYKIFVIFIFVLLFSTLNNDIENIKNYLTLAIISNFYIFLRIAIISNKANYNLFVFVLLTHSISALINHLEYIGFYSIILLQIVLFIASFVFSYRISQIIYNR